MEKGNNHSFYLHPIRIVIFVIIVIAGFIFAFSHIHEDITNQVQNNEKKVSATHPTIPAQNNHIKISTSNPTKESANNQTKPPSNKQIAAPSNNQTKVSENNQMTPASNNHVIQFSGYQWDVENEDHLYPGPNNWLDSKDNVYVDGQGRLHLKIIYRDGKWYAAGITNEQTLGYGTYRFYLNTRLDLMDPNVVLGLFTYDGISSDAAQNHFREIDMEFCRWGSWNNPYVGQYVIQPGHMKEYAFHLNGSANTQVFEWKPQSVSFYSLYGYVQGAPTTKNVIYQWGYSGTEVPNSKNEKVGINFWLFGGRAPLNGKEAEVIINKFEFTPYR